MPPPNTPTLLLILSVLVATAASSPYSTIAISHVNATVTLVCALLPYSNETYNLNCTNLHSRTHRQRSYPAGSMAFSAIAAGDGFLCALSLSSTTSTMRWWEFKNASASTNTTNSTTNSSEAAKDDSKRVYKGTPIVSLSAGDTHVCGLEGGPGRPNCWRWPQLPVPKDINFKDISVGRDFVCGLVNGSSSIKCFGNNSTGVVGTEPAGEFAMLEAGTSHACGVSQKGELSCWGEGPMDYDSKPFDMISSLSLGENRSCVLSLNGTVKCWGPNSELPKKYKDYKFLSIQAKGSTICGVLSVNFSLFCWGTGISDGNHIVYKEVLPGTCLPSSRCRCGVLPDSGNLCDEDKDEAICMPCPTKLVVATASLTKSTSKNRVLYIVLGAVGVAIATVAVAGFVAVHLYRLRRRVTGSGRHTAMVAPLPDRTPGRQPELRRGSDSEVYSGFVQEFPFSMIARVTGNFCEESKIGSGSFGSVYRATLDDGRIVAIKRAETASATSSSTNNAKRRRCYNESSFRSELALLSRVNHKNLVSLIGYCSEGAERVLLYEFMANGTLHDHLHKSPGAPLASWGARLRVALDAARGIEYLHSYAVPPIIHRDIKSSNILLDDTWTAKVSDFGLSSLMSSNEGEFDRCEPLRLTAGTLGYLDPEGYRLQNLTEKSDVYSFGVVMLELMTGYKAIHHYDSGTPRNVVEFVVPHIIVDNVERILDPSLPRPMANEIESVTYVCYLAADCVSPEGRDRPTMTEVVGGLERAMAAYGVTQAISLPRSSTSRTI